MRIDPTHKPLRSNAALARGLLSAATLGLAAWSPLAAQDRISIIGSDTLLPLNEALAAAYTKANPGVRFLVEGGGSEKGFAALLEDGAGIGASSRPIRPNEVAEFFKKHGYKPLEVPVALDAVRIYVHQSNPVTQLTMQGLAGLLSGEINNWSAVGGPDMPVTIYTRDPLSGTRTWVRQQVLNGRDFPRHAIAVPSSPALVAAVARNRGAIGYAGVAFDGNVRVLPVAKENGMRAYVPSRENVLHGRYPLGRTLYYYINQRACPPSTGRFMRWVISPEGQRVAEAAGYYSLPFGGEGGGAASRP